MDKTMDSKIKDNNNLLKSFGAVVIIIVGLYATVQPMSQRIDFLERQLETHENLAMHAGTEQRVMEMSVMSKEVSTKFEHITSRLDELDDWKTYYQRFVPARNAVQDERLDSMEQCIEELKRNSHK